MKQASLLSLAVVLAVAASALTNLWTARPRAADPGPSIALATGLEELQGTLSGIESRQRELDRRLEELATAPTAASTVPAPLDRSEVEAAVRSYLDREERGQEHKGGTPPAGASMRTSELASLDLDEILDALAGGGFGDGDVQMLWQEVRDAGRMDEVLAEFERMAEENPNNPDVQTDLGHAYIQKIMDVGSGPLAGKFGMLADAAYDRALELDPTHWDARFSKAVALSNWPAFLGKSGEAIQQFEVLVDQQANLPPSDEHAQTYLFLGNMYQRTGQLEKAIETWRSGLALYPDAEPLREQLRLAGQ